MSEIRNSENSTNVIFQPVERARDASEQKRKKNSSPRSLWELIHLITARTKRNANLFTFCTCRTRVLYSGGKIHVVMWRHCFGT